MSYEKSESIEQLATSLAIAQGAIQGAIKDSLNPAFGAPRKYADLSSCWEACRKQLSDNGLAVIQGVSAVGQQVTVTTILTHKSGQWISSALTVTSDKGTPQGIGSAITYGRRYSLSAMVGIAPADDDDGNEASGMNGEKQVQRGSRKAQEEVAERKVTEMSKPAAKTATTKDFDYLRQTADLKQALGEDLYRLGLKKLGYAKSNEATTPEEQKKVLSKLGAALKIVNAASHGELLPSVNEEIFGLLPGMSIAACMTEFRQKMKTAFGDEVGAEEYEGIRSQCKTQWEFIVALQRAWEKQMQNVSA